MDDDFTALGATEQYVANEIKKHIEACKTGVILLAEGLDKINVDGIEAAIIDPKQKEATTRILGLLEKLATNLSFAQLTLLIAEFTFKVKEKED